MRFLSAIVFALLLNFTFTSQAKAFEMLAPVIMPLGDSITNGTWGLYGSYREPLWQKMTELGYPAQFVGSLASGTFPQPHHEGHPGWRIDQIRKSIDGWMNTSRPSLVLLMIGTNDIDQNYKLDQAPARLADLVDQIFVLKPDVKIILATIPPISATSQTGCGGAACEQKVLALNSALPAIVSQRASQGKSISLVPMHDLILLQDLRDGVHPNEGGYKKMADGWLQQIRKIYGL
jgi:lysophospholipase L1-like esterase